MGPEIFHFLKVVINVLCLSSVALLCVFRFAVFLLFQTPENKLIITIYDKLELAPPHPDEEHREDPRSQMQPC